MGKNKMTPYTDIEVTDKYIIREFNENIDPIELIWHRDDESRTVEILEDTDWQFQLENCLPTSLKERIFIPRHEWHRVIKGTGTLKLKIHKSMKLDNLRQLVKEEIKRTLSEGTPKYTKGDTFIYMGSKHLVVSDDGFYYQSNGSFR
jgi:hypothetical protein